MAWRSTCSSAANVWIGPWLATPILTRFGLHWSSAVLVCGRSVAARPPNDPVRIGQTRWVLGSRANRMQTVYQGGFAGT